MRLDYTVFAGIKSTRHNLGRSFNAASELIDGDDRHHEAIFA